MELAQLITFLEFENTQYIAFCEQRKEKSSNIMTQNQFVRHRIKLIKKEMGPLLFSLVFQMKRREVNWEKIP